MSTSDEIWLILTTNFSKFGFSIQGAGRKYSLLNFSKAAEDFPID